MRSRSTFPWWLIAFNGGLAFVVTLLTIEFWQRRAGDLPAEELRMLRLVYRQVMHAHVEEHAGDQLMRTAIEGLVAGLADEYSRFIPTEKVREFDNETTGEYQGIGMAPAPRCVPLTVHYLMADGPAERAGLRVGDRIVRIDDDTLADVTPTDVVARARARLLGPPGTKVRLRVQRGNGETTSETDFEIERAGVQRPSVKWARLVDHALRVGYVHIATFQQRTSAEFDAALQQLTAAAGGALGGLVLDLRHNPGGLLDESVAVANRFLRAGNIVTLRARGGVEHGRHDVDPAKTTHPDLPLVVLVNGESASASEVLCGALQDHARAVVVGTNTFGKGVVQSIYRWEGLDFRLKLTTARYYTPKGRNIDRGRRGGEQKQPSGLAPDVETTLADEAARAVKAQLEAYEVPHRYKAAAAALAATLGFESEPAPVPPERDAQLAEALRVLREHLASPRASPTVTQPR